MIKKILLKCISLYQFFSKDLSLWGSQCTFYPSCSEYAYDAIYKHGVMRGVWLSIKRVSHCRPGKPFTVDIVQ